VWCGESFCENYNENVFCGKALKKIDWFKFYLISKN
jgi:hypothetical protein